MTSISYRTRYVNKTSSSANGDEETFIPPQMLNTTEPESLSVKHMHLWWGGLWYEEVLHVLSLAEMTMSDDKLHNLICKLNYNPTQILKVSSVPMLPPCQQHYCSLRKTKTKHSKHIFLLQKAQLQSVSTITAAVVKMEVLIAHAEGNLKKKRTVTVSWASNCLPPVN